MKDVFDLTQEDLDQRLRPIIDEQIDAQFSQPGYIIYRDERCSTITEFIREYRNGRKELVELDLDTRIYTVIRELP